MRLCNCRRKKKKFGKISGGKLKIFSEKHEQYEEYLDFSMKRSYMITSWQTLISSLTIIRQCQSFISHNVCLLDK